MKRLILTLVVIAMFTPFSQANETMDYQSLKTYTDPLWESYRDLPAEKGELGKVYKTFRENGASESEAQARTSAYIYRKATKEGKFYFGHSVWGEAKFSD